MGRSSEPPPAPRYARLRWWAWAAFTLAWSAALLLPVPEAGVRAVGEQHTLFSKVVHLGGYAALALLGFALPGRWRWAGLAFASLHAGGTELCQYLTEEWMHRHGAWADVGLDHVGIGLGLALRWAALKLRPSHTSLRANPSMPMTAAAHPVRTAAPAKWPSSEAS
jgi:hypothetical protein